MLFRSAGAAARRLRFIPACTVLKSGRQTAPSHYPYRMGGESLVRDAALIVTLSAFPARACDRLPFQLRSPVSIDARNDNYPTYQPED